MRRLLWLSLGLAAGIAVWGLGPGTPDPSDPDLAEVVASLPRPVPKVVLIGLDGADWNVARPLMSAGRMPTLAALVAAGASAELHSIHPMISPALWTSVVTGVGPESHGIHDFVYKRPGAYEQPIVDSTIRERLALWNILSGLGLTVGIVDWYATWPAEDVHGFIVSDRIKSLGAGAAGVTHPASVSLAPLPSSAPPPSPEQLPALRRFADRLPALPFDLDKALRDDLERYSLVKRLYAAHQPDFFAFYLKGIDAVGHFYWKYYQPDAEVYGSVDPVQAELLGFVIPTYYELCDQLLGDFLEGLAPDTVVLIISDHGFRAFGRPDSLIFDIDRLLSMMGLLEFEDPAEAGRRSGRRIRMAGTRAYAHDGTKIVSPFGEREQPVYLNVAGRDPQGIIPADDLAEAREEIRASLLGLRTDLGSRVFSNVRLNDDPAADSKQQEPDLYLRVNREIAFDHELELGGRSYSLFDLFLWEYGDISGTHRDEGIFVARGPGIRPGFAVDSPSLLDIAPTILRLFGAPVPRDFEGQALESMLVRRGAGNALRLGSYETLIERSNSAAAPGAPIDDEYRQRLRSLGYVQ